MLFALGAASSALDVLKSLNSSKPQSTALSQDSTSPFDLSAGTAASEGSPAKSGAGGGSQISPATMGALLAAQSQSSMGSATSALTSKPDALKDLFSQLDTNGDGQLGKSEFENGLSAGGTNLVQADDVFGKLDKDGDDAVSLDEMLSALKGKGHRHHHDVDGGSGDASGTGGSNSDPLLPACGCP